MKIEVSKWTFDGNTSYKILHMEECCNKLTNSMNVSINDGYDEFSNYDEQEYSVKLTKIVYDEDIGDVYRYEKINFCPFCGEPIEINIVEEVDKTEEYKLLKNKRKVLWSKCNNTDSKKEAEELVNQVRELDKKTNGIWENDGF